MAQKAYIQTYGCQMNEHDSFRMQEILLASGYDMVDSPDEASLILVNTCSVRANPENKVYSFLGALVPHKERNPELIVGVAGCVAQQEGEAILKRARMVDMVFGPDHYFRLPELIEAARRGERTVLVTEEGPVSKVDNFIPDLWLDRGHVSGCKAYVAISKGCDNYCSFCIVPAARGREVSREPDNILREAESLVAKGAKELWLLGQNVMAYKASGWRFKELLDAVSKVDGLRRLRFTSPHPRDWTNELADLMASNPVICHQLHMPLQAGADRILGLMNRRHTMRDYLDKVAYLRAAVPDIEISTDIIVGFPSETDEEFEATLEAMRVVRYSQLFSFKYSPRPGTKALKLGDDVPRDVKEERLRRLIALQDEINAGQMAAYVGTEQEVMVEGRHPKKPGVWNGRTGGFRPVSLNGDFCIGDLVRVHVTEASGHWLYADVIGPSA